MRKPYKQFKSLLIFGIVLFVADLVYLHLFPTPWPETLEELDPIPFILLLWGEVFIALYFFIFKTDSNTIVLTKFKKQNFYLPGWNFGSVPSNAKFIVQKKLRLHIPVTGGYEPDYLRLRAPDLGIIGLRLVITWSYDYSRPDAYEHTHEIDEINSTLLTRTQSALIYWIQGKPFPGTAKRALTNLRQVEQAVIEKITGINASALALPEETFLNLAIATPVIDLAIRIHEVNITEVELLKPGTGSPDWGGHDFIFDNDEVRMLLRQRVVSASNWRKEKLLLQKEFPEEADYIENLYEAKRLQSMEHHNH